MALGACAQVTGRAPQTDAQGSGAVQTPQAQPATPVVAKPPAGARTPEDFDTTTAVERAAAKAGTGRAGRELGLTVASLGSPTEPGFWIRTPLVSAPARGRVENPANGKSARVDLIPIDGPKTAGSRLSLAAMRLIGADLADLPEVRVFLLPD